MNVIVQAGHKSSNSKYLMEKLYEGGLIKPIDCYTTKMTPQQVTESINKLISPKKISLENKSLADNIIMDLVLANLEFENWGWEAQDNLFMPGKKIGENADFYFVLVFDHPKYLFNQASDEDVTVESTELRIKEWIEYHQKMKIFYEKNKKRSMLLQGSYTVNNISILNEKIQRISTSLSLKCSGDNKKISEKYFQEDCLFNLVTKGLLEKYPEAMQLYSDLLKHSDLNFNSEFELQSDISFESLVGLLKATNVKKVLNYNLISNNLDSLAVNRKSIAKASSRSYHEDILRELEIENSLLVNQLHQVQEELEYRCLKANACKSKDVAIGVEEIDKLDEALSLPKKIYLGAADRVKQDLPYRLGNLIVTQSVSPTKIIKLPFFLVKEFKKDSFINDGLPPIEEYADADEASKVKEHLSYKLGKNIVNSLQSPKKISLLPFTIIREVYSFKSNR